MTENIFYFITEQEAYNNQKNKIIDLDELKYQVDYNSMKEVFNNTNSNANYGEDFCYSDEAEFTARELECLASTLENEYLNNYTVKSLGQIMDYYELNKKHFKKDEIIQMLVIFETDQANSPLVEKRIRLWENIAELKKDKYFGKYIIFDN
ncbi:MAG: hypothetical protein WD512_18370 [Candidatus Paceibacterota bacterium]